MAWLGSRKLAQVAIVVRDIEAARDRYAKLLDVEPPNIIETKPAAECRQAYRGKPGTDRAKLAFFDLGGVQLELIQPLGTNSAWAEGHWRRTARVSTISRFWTENMKESVEYLDGEGAPLIMRGDMGDGQYAYFDGAEKFGGDVGVVGKRNGPDWAESPGRSVPFHLNSRFKSGGVCMSHVPPGNSIRTTLGAASTIARAPLSPVRFRSISNSERWKAQGGPR